MIVLWLILSLIVGVCVFFSKGCASAFGALVLCLFLLVAISACASC
jgi:hypothetical protein